MTEPKHNPAGGQQMASAPRWSIRWRITLGVVIFAAIGFGMLYSVGYPRVTGVLIDTRGREVQRQLEIVGNAILPFILQSQLGATHETLDQVLSQNSDWKSIELKRPNGRRLYPITPPPVGFKGEIISVAHAISFEGETVAILTADIDLGETLATLRGQVNSILWTVIASVTIACGLLAYTLDVFVGRRLTKLSIASRRLANGDFDAELPKDLGDEIGALSSSFGYMRSVVRDKEVSLRRARNTAERAAQIKSQFLATMSHEIRTPINGIIPVADLLLEKEQLTAGQRQKLETIRSSGSALLAVIDDILDVSKLESGRLELRQEQLDLRTLVDSVLDMLRVKANLGGIELRGRVSSNVPSALIGDENRIRQILINLVGNAIKFTSDGYVSVEIRVRPDVKRGLGIAPLSFKVTDTGVGIDKKHHAEVFERFSQVENSLSRRHSGTGLGLSITKALIDAMEGEIGIDSALGEGSTFWFNIDLPKAKVSNFPNLKIKTANEKSAQVTPLKILIAEDNHINQEVLRSMLENTPHSVSIVDDGKKAVEVVENHDFDILLADLQMPVMGGLEAARLVRELPEPKRNLRIVGVSASAFEQDRRDCVDAGMDDFLAKPISRKALFEVLERQSSQPRLSEGEEAR